MLQIEVVMGRRKNKPRTKPHRQKASRREHGIGRDGAPELAEFVQGSPFAGMSEEERKRLLRELGDRFASTYEEAFPKLQAMVARAEPLQLLSLMSLSSLYTQGRSGGEREPGAVLQAFYELVHALALRTVRDLESQTPLLTHEISAVQTLAEEVSTAFHMRRLRDLAGVDGGVDSRRQFLVQQARSATQVTRNWAYPDQIVRITRELFSPLDSLFTATWGVTATCLIDMLMGAIQMVEGRLRKHFDVLRPMYKARSIAQAVSKYYEAYPEMEGSPEDLANVLGSAHVEHAKHLLLEHAALRLPEVFTLSLEDWAAQYGHRVDKQRLREVLDRWSFAFGDLAETEPEYIFLGNPIWERPLIRLSEEMFLLPHPGMLFSFMLDMLEGLASAEPKVNKTYLARRGSYLEDAVAALFERAFPGARAWRGSVWKGSDGTEWENDLLVVVDNVAFVVESKAGRVTAQARRGAEKTLSRDISKLVAAPAEQATRFAELLRACPGTLRLLTRGRQVNEIDVSAIRLVVPLSITLEHLGALATNWASLQVAGFVPSDAPFAPTMTLGDLEIIFDALPRASEKLHYLWRRASFEQRVNLHGDEMDLLAFYLQTGFNIGDDEFDPEFALNVGGLSVDTVDAYYMRRSSDQHVPKPRRRLTKWWGDLVDYVERKKPPMWTILGIELLRVAEGEQQEFERGFKRVQKAVRRNKAPKDRDPVAVLVSSAQQQRAAIAGVAYDAATRQNRMGLLKSATRSALSEGAPAAVVIGADVDQPVYPCNSLGFSVPMSTDGEPASYFS